MTGNDLTPRQFVESLLPSHYIVHFGIDGIINCNSDDGIDNDTQWQEFMDSIKKYFGKSFKEVHHTICYNHKRFTVYYSYYKLNNIDFEHKLLPHEARNDKNK